ncbi:MAG: hypothetical protein EPN73_19780 [Paraburkholderia sp.]|uniref:hypothetical protein n=1 Tax=Paraburkholderia sp. TaxID=1926495 RepID=UPI001225EBCF|nr:hypothetical protein [Paraburkholderia sp.]TAL93775.1 MAG: hypothetical protein EPN73_19780 [Paraburkholderia sp.]
MLDLQMHAHALLADTPVIDVRRAERDPSGFALQRVLIARRSPGLSTMADFICRQPETGKIKAAQVLAQVSRRRPGRQDQVTTLKKTTDGNSGLVGVACAHPGHVTHCVSPAHAAHGRSAPRLLTD